MDKQAGRKRGALLALSRCNSGGGARTISAAFASLTHRPSSRCWTLLINLVTEALLKAVRWVHDNLFSIVMTSVLVTAYGVIALGVAQKLGFDISALIAH
ncbi:hypothetical protein ABLT15_30055 [Paraburkholderia tropica]|uniref:hypothetical protein n=1 Tax=Paraburkholderia tropica TaxID=92647 RepID=UPI0032B55478